MSKRTVAVVLHTRDGKLIRAEMLTVGSDAPKPSAARKRRKAKREESFAQADERFMLEAITANRKRKPRARGGKR